MAIKSFWNDNVIIRRTPSRTIYIDGYDWTMFLEELAEYIEGTLKHVFSNQENVDVFFDVLKKRVLEIQADPKHTSIINRVEE